MLARLPDKIDGRRRGTVLPVVAVSLVCLCGFVALAIDLGMVALAKTECQNAADSAALGGARPRAGSASPTLSAAPSAAQGAATAVKVLGASLQTSDVAIRHGTYHY